MSRKMNVAIMALALGACSKPVRNDPTPIKIEKAGPPGAVLLLDAGAQIPMTPEPAPPPPLVDASMPAAPTSDAVPPPPPPTFDDAAVSQVLEDAGAPTGDAGELEPYEDAGIAEPETEPIVPPPPSDDGGVGEDAFIPVP